jgi:peptidoglycan/LPS O-acetylase OafA/YrhL
MTDLSLDEYFSSEVTWAYLKNVFAYRISHHLPGVFENNIFPHAVNGSLWTLRFEIGCYLAVMAVGLFLRRKFIFAAITCLILGLFFRWVFVNQNALFFAVGAGIYCFRRYIWITSLGALVSVLFFCITLYLSPPSFVAVPVIGLSLGYLIIYLAFLRPQYFSNFAKNGDFSYGIYIWAFPIQQIVASQFTALNIATHFLIAFIVSLVLAFASWHLIEKPALRLKHTARRSGLIFNKYAHLFAVSK